MENQKAQAQNTSDQIFTDAIHFDGHSDPQTGGIEYRIHSVHGSLFGLTYLSAAIAAEVLGIYVHNCGQTDTESLCMKYVEDFLYPLLENVRTRECGSELNMARIAIDVKGALKQALEDKKNEQGDAPNV